MLNDKAEESVSEGEDCKSDRTSERLYDDSLQSNFSDRGVHSGNVAHLPNLDLTDDKSARDDVAPLGDPFRVFREHELFLAVNRVAEKISSGNVSDSDMNGIEPVVKKQLDETGDVKALEGKINANLKARGSENRIAITGSPSGDYKIEILDKDNKCIKSGKAALKLREHLDPDRPVAIPLGPGESAPKLPLEDGSKRPGEPPLGQDKVPQVPTPVEPIESGHSGENRVPQLKMIDSQTEKLPIEPIKVPPVPVEPIKPVHSGEDLSDQRELLSIAPIEIPKVPGQIKPINVPSMPPIRNWEGRIQPTEPVKVPELIDRGIEQQLPQPVLPSLLPEMGAETKLPIEPVKVPEPINRGIEQQLGQPVLPSSLPEMGAETKLPIEPVKVPEPINRGIEQQLGQPVLPSLLRGAQNVQGVLSAIASLYGDSKLPQIKPVQDHPIAHNRGANDLDVHR